MKQSLIKNQENPYGNFEQQEQKESNVLIFIFALLLMFFTYGLVVALFVLWQKLIISYVISIPTYQRGTDIYFVVFAVYVILVGAFWRWGYGRRQQLRKKVIQRQLQLQKLALQG